MADDLSIIIGASIDGILAGVGAAKGALAGLEGAVESVEEGFEKLTGTSLGFEAIKDWIGSIAELGEELEKAAARLGVTASEASALMGVSRLTGVEFGGLSTSLEQLQLRLASARGETGPAEQGLKAFGLAAKDLRDIPLPEQINRLADAFEKFADSPTKTAAAMAALGRAGADLIPFFDRGRKGMEELNEVAKRTGAIMSDDMVESFAKTEEHIQEAGLAWQGLSNKIFQVVNPAIDAAIKEFIKLVESMKIDDLRADIIDFVGSVGAITISILQFCAQAVGAIKEVIAVFSGLSQLVSGKAMEMPKFAGAGATVEEADADAKAKREKWLAENDKSLPDKLGDIQKETADQLAKIGELGEKYKKISQDFFRPPQETGGKNDSKDKPLVPSMEIGKPSGGAKGDDGALQSKMTNIDAEIDAVKAAAREEQAATDAQLKNHQITQSQWLAQTLATLDREGDATDDLYEKENAFDGLKVNQHAAILKKISDADIANNKAILQAQTKAAEAAEAEWKKASDKIADAFSGQVGALLKGTENFGQAFAKIVGSLITDFIQSMVKMGVQWVLTHSGMQAAYTTFQAWVTGETVAGEAAQTTATTAGTAARTGVAATGAAAGAAAQKPGLLAAITADVGEAFAGFSAFFAPLLGPAAPAAAAGLATGVQATAVSMAAFDQGAWNLSHDQIAMVHQGETIIPAAEAGALRSGLSAMVNGGGAGGVTHNWTINAADARSFAQMLNNNSSPLARAVARATNSNPSYRPAY